MLPTLQHARPRPSRLPPSQTSLPTLTTTGTLSSMPTASPRLPALLQPPSPSRPTPLVKVGVLATSAAVACAKPPSAPCCAAHRQGSARWSRPSSARPVWFPSAAGDPFARAPVRRRGSGLPACCPGLFETVLEDLLDSPVGSVNSVHFSVSSSGDPPPL